jgi:hypothetical protein
MMDYRFAQYRAEELQRRAAQQRLVREAAVARRRERRGARARLADAARQSRPGTAPARLREC